MRHKRGPGDRVGSRYVLVDELGAGGMATAWRAWDEKLMQYVCVKVADLGEDVTLRQRWVAESVLRVGGPHILGVRDWNSGQHGDYIVMSLMAGGSLADLVDRTGPLPPGQVLEVVRQTAAALQGMHRARLMHRDIKPSNLLLEPTPRGAALRLFVADFGVITDQSGAGVTQATSGPPGTPGFVPPEALQAPGDVGRAAPDGRIDLYALGVTAHFAATGELATATRPDLPPWWRTYTDPRELELSKVMPPTLAVLVAEMMTALPEGRPRSAAAVVKRCEEIAHIPFELGDSFCVPWALPALPPGWGSTGPVLRSNSGAKLPPTRNESVRAGMDPEPGVWPLTQDSESTEIRPGKTEPYPNPLTKPDRDDQFRAAENPPGDTARGQARTFRGALAVVAVVAALVAAAITGVAVASRLRVGGAAGPVPSMATTASGTTTPSTRPRLNGPTTPGASEVSFEHFRVALLDVSTAGPQLVDVMVRVCVLSATPDAIGGRTRISWEPWLLAVRNATPSSPEVTLAKRPGMLPESQYYDTGTCAQGKLPFRIPVGAAPSAVLYRNKQGDVATFAVP